MNSEQHAHEVLDKVIIRTQSKLVAELLRETDIEKRYETLTVLDTLAVLKKQFVIEMDKHYDPE
jgi:hypothetical protein